MEDEDPKLDQLAERVARLEEDNKWYKEKFNEMDKRIKEVDSKTWYILGGIIVTILIEIVDILVRFH
jgi:chromosome segregation ATPase